MDEGIHLISPNTPNLPLIIESVVLIHAACILNDNTMATFVPPLSHDKMSDHWNDLVAQTRDKRRLILVYISKVESRSPSPSSTSPFTGHVWPGIPAQDGISQLEVSGVTSLSNPQSETGPFRGLVQKLFISPFHRRKRIATNLLTELEKQAFSLGRRSLMLDTIVGTPAEHMYPKLGYIKLGVVYEYGISPKDGSLLDEVFYWKDLRRGTLAIGVDGT